MAASSMIVSLAVLVFGAIQYRAVARKDYVDELRGRIESCEKRHRDAEDGRADCERERERLTKLSMGLVEDMRAMVNDRIRAAAQHPPPPS